MPPRSRRQQASFKLSIRWTYALVGVVVLAALGGGGFLTAAHMEDNDAFCSSCHTEPETTFVGRAQAGNPSDLASFHTTADTPTKCIDCHSGVGVSGRAAAMTLGAFDLVAYLSGKAEQPAPLKNPISDANCIKCHQDVPATRSFDRHFHKFLAQWQTMDPKNAATCVSCHTGHVTDGDPALGFLNEAHTVAVCQRCHTAAGEDVH